MTSRNQSIISKSLWGNPEYIEKVKKGREPYLKKFSEITRKESIKRWANPTFRTKMEKIFSSPEYKSKLSESHKGKAMSREHYQKLSELYSGRKIPENQRKKISESLKRYHATKHLKTPQQKIRKKYSMSKFGRNKLVRRNILRCKGKTYFQIYPPEQAQKLIEIRSGENSASWIDGRSFKDYPFEWTKNHRRKIRERDQNTCQLCGKTKSENGRDMDVHHIDYTKENIDEKNLICLCCSDNAKVNFNRVHFQKIFAQKIAQKYMNIFFREENTHESGCEV